MRRQRTHRVTTTDGVAGVVFNDGEVAAAEDAGCFAAAAYGPQGWSTSPQR